jgi:hypothetical protein
VALLNIEPLGSRVVGGKGKKSQWYWGLFPAEKKLAWFKILHRYGSYVASRAQSQEGKVRLGEVTRQLNPLEKHRRHATKKNLK